MQKLISTWVIAGEAQGQPSKELAYGGTADFGWYAQRLCDRERLCDRRGETRVSAAKKTVRCRIRSRRTWDKALLIWASASGKTKNSQSPWLT